MYQDNGNDLSLIYLIYLIFLCETRHEIVMQPYICTLAVP